MKIAGRVFLKKGRDGPVRGGNPWIFSQAIARVEPPALAAGDGVEIRDAGGDMLGIGYYNPNTTIAVRLLGFGAGLAPEQIVEHRLRDAVWLRSRIIGPDTNCYRLLNGDGDGLSGVVADCYGDVVVIQFLTSGADAMRDEILNALERVVAPRAIIERSQGAVRRQEGLPDRAGLLAGEPVTETVVMENGTKVAVDLEQGQKTGHFLDQRENRLTARRLAQSARVLDICCYSGGFLLAALAGGATSAVGVDTSARALGWARRNLELNGYDARACALVQAEAARYLAAASDRFDLVVLDPPPLARSIKDAAQAGRLYVGLNMLAMRALAPGGHLMTFSCSAHFRGEDFIRAIRTAQTRAQRHFRMLAHLGPGPDHPVLLGHPEGEYLTGLLLADLG
jgi:23S rRNA (cytosine1962-C5)-methyltransferase